MPELILASSSRYRQALLKRLGLSFRALRPDIDESPLPGEAATALVERLAAAKAAKVAATVADERSDGIGQAALVDPGNDRRLPGKPAVIIGSDQVAVVDGPQGERVLGKPGNRAEAIAQLGVQSGREVRFLTSLCVRDADGGEQLATETTRVTFRSLSAVEIAAYVDRERPFDCCGAFRSEGLGLALTQRIEATDPNALIGLPLIRLCAMLRQLGLDPLAGGQRT